MLLLDFGSAFGEEAGHVSVFEAWDDHPVELLSLAGMRVQEVDSWRDWGGIGFGGSHRIEDIPERLCRPGDRLELTDSLQYLSSRIDIGRIYQAESFFSKTLNCELTPATRRCASDQGNRA